MILAPSILSADFGRLAEQVALAERGGASVVHVDVMDGHFVPNITIGVPVVEAIRKRTRLPLDLHLMIVEPEKYVGDFAKAGGVPVVLRRHGPPAARLLADRPDLKVEYLEYDWALNDQHPPASYGRLRLLWDQLRGLI